MPISNSEFTVNVGRDVSIRMIAPDGTKVDVSNLLMTELPKPQYDTLDLTRNDGKFLHADLPTKGWMGAFELYRSGNEIMAMFSKIDKNWRTKGQFNFGTLYVYTTEADGSQTTDRYNGVSFKLDDAGKAQGDKEITMKIGFHASTKD